MTKRTIRFMIIGATVAACLVVPPAASSSAPVRTTFTEILGVSTWSESCIRTQVSFALSQGRMDADGAVYYERADVAFSRFNTCTGFYEIAHVAPLELETLVAEPGLRFARGTAAGSVWGVGEIVVDLVATREGGLADAGASWYRCDATGAETKCRLHGQYANTMSLAGRITIGGVEYLPPAGSTGISQTVDVFRTVYQNECFPLAVCP